MGSLQQNQNMLHQAKYNTKMKTMTKLNYIIALFGIILISSCDADPFGCLKGEGEEVSRTLNLPEITRIDLNISGKVTIREGESQIIVINSQDNVIDAILADSNLSNGNWQIDIDGCSSIDEVEIDMTLPNIQGIQISGSGEVLSDGVFQNIGNLQLEIDGSGKIKMDLGDANEISMEMSGSGEIELTGSTETQNIDINGSGDIKNKDLISEICNIQIDGSGDCFVHANQQLRIEINGSGDVCYTGEPTISFESNGSGNLDDCN